MQALFVYGTLMPGQESFGIIEPFVADRIPAATAGILHDLETYPAMVPGTGVVCGWLVQISRRGLAVSDDFEEARPNDPAPLFRRALTSVLLADGSRHRSWAYFFAQADKVRMYPHLRVGQYRGRPIFAWRPKLHADH